MTLGTKRSYPVWLQLIPKPWPGISFLVMSENKFILKGWCFANIKNVQKDLPQLQRQFLSSCRVEGLHSFLYIQYQPWPTVGAQWAVETSRNTLKNKASFWFPQSLLMTVAKQERGVTGLPGAPGLDSALPTQGAGIKIPHNSAKERGERERCQV